MDKFIIAPHSVVDIITNSSTVIYTTTQDSAKDAITGIINELLRAAGSPMLAEDLYNITVINITADKQRLRREDFASEDDYWYAYDEIDEMDIPEQVPADVDYPDVRGDGAILIESKYDGNESGRLITELLGKLFVVTEVYM